MIKIIAKIIVKDGMIDDFKETAKELVEKSAAEEGNVSYSLNQNINNANEFVFMEIWKSDEAIKLHHDSEHFTTIFPKLQEMAAEEPKISLYNVI